MLLHRYCCVRRSRLFPVCESETLVTQDTDFAGLVTILAEFRGGGAGTKFTLSSGLDGGLTDVCDSDLVQSDHLGLE
jgi:hypothetical protein